MVLHPARHNADDLPVRPQWATRRARLNRGGEDLLAKRQTRLLRNRANPSVSHHDDRYTQRIACDQDRTAHARLFGVDTGAYGHNAGRIEQHQVGLRVDFDRYPYTAEISVVVVHTYRCLGITMSRGQDVVGADGNARATSVSRNQSDSSCNL